MKFIDLVKNAKQILVLDAQLIISGVRFIEYLANRTANVVYNIHKPYAGHTFTMHLVKGANNIQYIEEVKKSHREGKNVYSYLSRKGHVLDVEETMKKLGAVVQAFHGDNTMINQTNG